MKGNCSSKGISEFKENFTGFGNMQTSKCNQMFAYLFNMFSDFL